MPVKEFEDTLKKFVAAIQITPGYAERLTSAVMTEWERRETERLRDDAHLDTRIGELKAKAKLTVDKIKMFNSEVAIKYMEEDLLALEGQIAELVAQKATVKEEESMNMQAALATVRYFLEHLDYLLFQQINPLARAACFAVLSMWRQPTQK